jgi:hypothetical protein
MTDCGTALTFNLINMLYNFTIRSFNPTSLNNFKTALSGTDWTSVSESHDVDEAYNLFWSSYIDLYELFFPKKQIRFNSNVHKRSPFMTAGLLISRQNKNALFKLQLAENTPANVNKYKIFKQTYFKTVREAQSFTFSANFKKILEILKKLGTH